MTKSKTKTMTIGVPISTYALFENDEIRHLLPYHLTDYEYFGLSDLPKEKIVKVTLRLNITLIDKIKHKANKHNLSIIEFTSRLF